VLSSTFSPDDSGDECHSVSSPCGAGLYRDVAPTLSSDRTCAECALGHFKGEPGNEACALWVTCPVGFGKSKEGSTTANRECAPCIDGDQHPRTVGGSFSNTDSGDGCSALLTCGNDEYQTAAPTRSSDRECATHRDKCPDGQFTFKGVTAHADRVCHAITTCVAGKYETAAFSASSNRYCEDCPSGTYQDQENKLQCVGCTAGKHRNSQLASSAEAAACTKCIAGRVSWRAATTECTLCEAGKYQATEGQTTCQDCGSGTYQHQQGQDECKNCAAGKHRNTEAASSVEAVACTTCESGTYQDQEAKLECLACVAGKFRNAEDASAAEFNACTQCAAGRFQDANGEIDCINCAAGKHRTAAAAYSAEDDACTSCAPGYYQNLVAKLSCIACVGGKHRNTADASAAEEDACTACAQGQYQNQLAQLTCVACAAGKHRTTADASSDESVACLTCATGTYQAVTGQTSCIACDGGKYRNTAAASAGETFACTACLNGRFQALSAQLACDACPIGRFPHSDKKRCDAHNTMEHICRARRSCKATGAWKGKPLPDQSIGTFYFKKANNINSIDDWCDFQCAAAPDRWTKQFCPDADGAYRVGQMCECHEQRTSTATDVTAADQECNDHEMCSHVTCKKQDHMCPSHSKFKAWAAAHGKTVTANICDDGLSHHSIRVFHHGLETTCKHGHYCFMKGDQCVCVQKTPSRPDEDRCWYDVHTPASIKACYRRCKQHGDAKACAASANFSDTKKPAITLCGGSAERVTNAKWDLCPSRAMDQIDGDMSSSITYTLTRFTAEEGETKLCDKCDFGHAKARFHNHFGSLQNGQYILHLEVCDKATNCATVEKAIEVELS
jgi:hypothetical protein